MEFPAQGGLAGHGVNDKGVAIGEAYLADGSYHGFVYRNGLMKDLGT